ncbi:MAG: ornithine--oxo-acid transaminase [Deltaproteobacteria bacterium]|nr:ornithine--oxo-acid transaminase [Deltaproteobacteria bacterium]
MHPAVAQAERFGAHNYHPLDVVLVRGAGAWVTDSEGRRYLDCLSAYSALNQGHCHPRIIAALHDQAGRITLSSRAFHNDKLGPFLQQLCELSGFDRALVMNSGAEAVETAIKAARKWAYQVKGVRDGAAEIVVAADNFHGRTTTVVSASTEPQYRAGFGPFTPGFKVVPFGDVAATRAAIGPNTAAVLVEPIQGEAGIRVPPDDWLPALRAACDEAGCLLILDEIQTGFGRTGKMFDFLHSGIRPDGITVGKALGGGVLPVSAFLASEQVMNVFEPGDHGSTFGGNPLACAVGRAALDVLVDERLAERAQQLGTWFRDELRALNSRHVVEVRGRGLLIGLEIAASSGPALPFCLAAKDRGLLCKDTHGSVIRLAPPLIADRDALGFALGVLREVLA